MDRMFLPSKLERKGLRSTLALVGLVGAYESLAFRCRVLVHPKIQQQPVPQPGQAESVMDVRAWFAVLLITERAQC